MKDSVVADFNRYAVQSLKRNVWSKGCTGWYGKKDATGEGKVVTAMYPGSILHYKGISHYANCRIFHTKSWQSLSKRSAASTSIFDTAARTHSGIWATGSWRWSVQRAETLHIIYSRKGIDALITKPTRYQS